MQRVLVQGGHRELQRVGHGPKPNPSPGRGTERPGTVRRSASSLPAIAPSLASGLRTIGLTVSDSLAQH